MVTLVRSVADWLVTVASTRARPPGSTTGGWMLVCITMSRHAGGMSVALVPSSAEAESPWSALKPRPRLANDSQMRHWLAPALVVWSARRMASRASTKPGMQGCSFSASITSWMAVLLPPVPWARSASKPSRSMNAHVMSHSIAAKTEPTPWGMLTPVAIVS